MKRSAQLWLSVLVAACTAAAAPPYELTVRVESDPGRPLAGARLMRAGKLLGTTDDKGTVQVAVAGSAGETLELEAACPAGHRSPDKPLSVVLKPLMENGRRPEYRVSCAPLVRSLVVSVRAQNGAGLPVKYLGKEIARTDANGAAHALLKVSPGETVTVVLDTSAPEHAGLMPQNPELKLTVPERDDVVLFDQTFTLAKSEEKKRHRAARGNRPQKL
jgi:hypothetical protein